MLEFLTASCGFLLQLLVYNLLGGGELRRVAFGAAA